MTSKCSLVDVCFREDATPAAMADMEAHSSRRTVAGKSFSGSIEPFRSSSSTAARGRFEP